MKLRLGVCWAASLIFLAGAGVVMAQVAPQQAASDCVELPAVKAKLDRDEARLQDWAELSRYRAANAAISAPATDELRVVFMGDSITDSWSRPEFGGFFPGKAYINRGISGQTTPQMLIRFRPDVIELQPKVAVILAGTNDIAGNTGPMSLEDTEANVSSMAELARAHGVRVVLASLLPVSDYGHSKDGAALVQSVKRPPAQILALNKWLQEYATQNGYTYLDYFSALVDEQGMLKRELSEDGLHPNAKGYAVMAPLAEQAIRAALEKKR